MNRSTNRVRSLIICERNGHDRATNTRRTADDRSFILSHMDAHACAWIAVDAKMNRYARQKILPRRACDAEIVQMRRTAKFYAAIGGRRVHAAPSSWPGPSH